MFCSCLRLVGRIPRHTSITNVAFKRCFLSPAFRCEESWKKRLETPVIKKCVPEDFFFELDAKYSQSEQIAPIDVDVFVNAITDQSHLDEMQDLVHKLRLSKDACDILPSTHHALIRVLLDLERYEDLIDILNDRLNYGIFPDDYTTLLLFDTFLKLMDFKNAVKIAAFHMLQENFENKLISYYALYSCHNYLLNPTEWAKPVEPVQEEDDGEEIKVRVGYLRNPFFDDHFDLTEANDLIGKTLLMVGRSLNNEIGKSYQLLGSVLYRKFDLAESCIKDIVNNKQSVHKDIFDLIMKQIEGTKEVKTDETNKTDEADKSEAKADEVPKPQANEKQTNDLENALQLLTSNNLISESKALAAVEDQIKQIVRDSESQMIAQQQSTFQEWTEMREKLLRDMIDRQKKDARLAEVEGVKEELKRKEKELFFFDQEDMIDLEIEKKEAEIKEGLGRSATKTEVTSPDQYLPPDIVKQRQN